MAGKHADVTMFFNAFAATNRCNQCGLCKELLSFGQLFAISRTRQSGAIDDEI